MLDLIYTNEEKTINEVNVQNTTYSDHKRIEVETTIKIKSHIKGEKQSEIEEDKFRELNIRNDEINWEQIGIRIEDIDWENNKEISNSENMIENFIEIIYEICQNGIKKKSIGRSKIPKELRQMLGRLKRLIRKARKHNNEEKRKEMIELKL